MRKWKPTLQGHRWVRFRNPRYISRFHQPWICRIPDSVMKHPGFHASCNSNLPKLVRNWALKHWRCCSNPSLTIFRCLTRQVGEFLGPAARFCRVLLLGEPGCWGLSQLAMFFFGYDVFHGVLFKRHSETWIRNSWISFLWSQIKPKKWWSMIMVCLKRSDSRRHTFISLSTYFPNLVSLRTFWPQHIADFLANEAPRRRNQDIRCTAAEALQCLGHEELSS